MSLKSIPLNAFRHLLASYNKRPEVLLLRVTFNKRRIYYRSCSSQQKIDDNKLYQDVNQENIMKEKVEEEKWQSPQVFDPDVNKINADKIDINSIEVERGVPKTWEEFRLRKRLTVQQPPVPRLATVAILGVPNAGKSTLTNSLVGWKISSVSKKVHTTRHKVVGILVEDDVQVEFLDTPGVVTHKHCVKHKLEHTFMSDPPSSVDAADIIAVIADCSNIRDQQSLNPGIINILQKNYNKESILILNKIDKIKGKRDLLEYSTRLSCGIVDGVRSVVQIRRGKMRSQTSDRRNLSRIFEETERRMELRRDDDDDMSEDEDQIGWPHFSRVFMVSALSGDGVDDIREYLLTRAKFRPWIYPKSQVTDQSPQEILKSTIKEKCLDLMPQEIPYTIGFRVEMWELDRAGNLHIAVDVLCPERYQKMVIGPKGSIISAVVQQTKLDLANIFHCDVSLKLIVKGVKSK